MKLVLTYILISLLVCFSTSYAIEGQWTSDKYANVVLTVTGYSTNLDGTNVYQLSVNSCPFVYKIQIDQSYITMLNLDQKKGINNCSLLNSTNLAQEVEQRIFYFYINYSKLGFVSIFGNKTNILTRVTKNTTNDYLNGQYQDIVTGQIVVFRNSTVYLCNYNLEGDYLTDNFNSFQLNISSVINNKCQSKNNNAQKVLQILGQATNYRVQKQNILTFYDLAKPTLRLKFVQRATYPPKSTDSNKNDTTASTGVSNSTKEALSSVVQNSINLQGNQKNIGDLQNDNSTSNNSNTSSPVTPTLNNSSKYQSNGNSTGSINSASSPNNSQTSTDPKSQNTISSTMGSNLTNRIPKNTQNLSEITTNTHANLNSAPSNLIPTNESSNSTSTNNGIVKIQTQASNSSASSTFIQGREPYTGIEIRNQNSIGVWNVQYFKNPSPENWPSKMRINGTYLILQACNTISIPAKLDSKTLKFITTSTGIISTRKACGDADQVTIDVITKANRFEPVRNSSSIMLNFYQNDQLLWSMSRIFNQGQAQNIKDFGKGSIVQISSITQTSSNKITSTQTVVNTSSQATNFSQSTISTNSVYSSTQSSQIKNTSRFVITNVPSINSNNPQSSSTLLIGKYHPNSLYQLNLPAVLGQKYTYTFNSNSISVVGTCNSYKYLYTLQQGDSSVFSVDQSSEIQQKPNGSTCDSTEDALYLRILFQGKSIQKTTNGGVNKLNILNASGKVIAVLQKKDSN